MKRSKHLFTILIFIFAALSCLLNGCTGLKCVETGQYLYSGNKIKFDSTEYLENKTDIKSELSGIIATKPNMKFLWMRPFLSIFNMIPEPEKKSGIKYWMKYKLGEPPQFMTEINPDQLALSMKNSLQNHGYYGSEVKYKVKKNKKTAVVYFRILPSQPYKLDSIFFPELKSGIDSVIKFTSINTLLIPGTRYDLQIFEKERSRIESALKEKGYYNFKADHILFVVDTFHVNHTFRTWVTVKSDLNPEFSTAYRFKAVYINDDYSLRDYYPDTVRLGNYFYLTKKHQFKPQTILDAVYLEKDSLYRQKDHYNTLRQLMGIGVYKFASVRFVPDSIEFDKMNVNILLTPIKKISLSTELNGAIKSNNYAGPGLNLNYRNRNLFGGAELLTLTLGGRIDFQYGYDTKGEFSYEVTFNSSLTLPRFVPSQLTQKTSKSYIPKTIISAGIGAFSRNDLYQLNSFNSTWGYNWRTSQKKSHLLNVADMSYTNMVKSSDEFNDYLNENPTVKKSFDDQFIIGSSYTFDNNNFHFSNQRHVFSISEGVDFSGNLASLITSFIKGETPDAQHPFELLGLPYSQFFRLRSELRYMYKPSASQQIASRIIVATAIPYGNSNTIPYIKQYFVGGTSSIRAFIARSIGPGTYHPPDSVDNIYIDQAGDIKIETNLEYRFNIYKFFKGALFIDAGNIWLVNADSQRVGGEFQLNTFYRELAAGVGYGFRFDFNVIILRLDLAIPIRIPYNPEGERWVLDNVNFGNQDWRQKNLLWNIAIGYPF